MLMRHRQMEFLCFWESQVSVGQSGVGLKGVWVKVRWDVYHPGDGSLSLLLSRET